MTTTWARRTKRAASPPSSNSNGTCTISSCARIRKNGPDRQRTKSLFGTERERADPNRRDLRRARRRTVHHGRLCLLRQVVRRHLRHFADRRPAPFRASWPGLGAPLQCCARATQEEKKEEAHPPAN